MSRVRVCCFSISLDGYGAGPDQSLESPLGRGAETLHDWLVQTRTFRSMTGEDGGTTGADDAFAASGFERIGAWIIGRNMFGPVRGPWPDESWRGWWGDEPPYHVPVFVLTRHPRPSLVMQGGTVFHFVGGRVEDVLGAAREAAGDLDVRIGGGAATIREFLSAGLIDEMHVAIAPVLLGGGEHLYAGIDLLALGYRCTAHVPTEAATHIVLGRSPAAPPETVLPRR